MVRALSVLATPLLLVACADASFTDLDEDVLYEEDDRPFMAASAGLVEAEPIPVISEGETASSPPCATLDFDTDPSGVAIDAGEDLETRYSSVYGLTIATFDKAGSSSGTAITFDSSDPTGGDVDLGTPNEAYGGPGESNDGSGASNDVDQYNVMIRAEDTVDTDGDGLVDDPDDHAKGALFEFTWRKAQNMDSVVLLDIEGSEVPAEIRGYDASGSLVGSVDAGGEGDNSREEVELDWANVLELTIKIQGSGAIDDLVFCPTSSIPE